MYNVEDLIELSKMNFKESGEKNQKELRTTDDIIKGL